MLDIVMRNMEKFELATCLGVINECIPMDPRPQHRLANLPSIVQIRQMLTNLIWEIQDLTQTLEDAYSWRTICHDVLKQFQDNISSLSIVKDAVISYANEACSQVRRFDGEISGFTSDCVLKKILSINSDDNMVWTKKRSNEFDSEDELNGVAKRRYTASDNNRA